MRDKFIFLVGIIIFIAFVWLVTTIGFQNSLKKEESPPVSVCHQDKFDNTFL